MINEYFQSVIKKVTGADLIREVEVIQNLWSGYGEIVRLALEGSDLKRIVVKHVNYPKTGNHPRGWNTNLSHQRKLRSYQVETNWYRDFGNMCDDSCRIPHCLAVETKGEEVLMVLEDLDAAGFPVRKRTVNWEEMKSCLSWLANFHATFMGSAPDGLWESGTYWHLETRPEEMEALDDLQLKDAAALIDRKLKNSPYQTLVHGDAKLANFCFAEKGNQVAAVDFQYVGAGCGMKDLAYFIGSCLNEQQSEKMENQILDVYFEKLKQAVANKNTDIDSSALEKDWRRLFPVAWADFHRFLKGWSPGHWKINDYSERISREVVAEIQKENS